MSDSAETVPEKARILAKRSESFSGRLRQLRRDAGLTLQQVSEKTGLALSTISKFENNHSSPTYENIVRLAEGLGIDVSELFSTHPQPMASGRMSITRAGEGVRHRAQQYDYEILCTELSHKRFLPLTAVVKARTIEAFPLFPAHTGEEFVYVLTGEIIIHTEHYRPITLLPGDSCYFDSRMGHALIAAGDEDATVLWVCSHLDLPLSASDNSSRGRV